MVTQAPEEVAGHAHVQEFVVGPAPVDVEGLVVDAHTSA
jgi:hypothetical protein